MMDSDDLMLAFMQVIVVLMIGFLVIGIPILSVSKNLGKTQVVGYVVNVEQATFIWPHTTVTFTIEHPTSIVDAHYFERTYAGYQEFELHQRYRITADKILFEWYPRIVGVELLE